MIKKLDLVLPYPPSVNTYWGFRGSHRFLTNQAKEFKKYVQVAYQQTEHQGFGVEKLRLTVMLYPPDKRVRDIDNIAKPLLDALCQAKIFADDGQIDWLTIIRQDIKKGGECQVCIELKK
jgi:crossover junction endodeoxyribonuclease RusA